MLSLRSHGTQQSKLTSLTRPWFIWVDPYQEASCKYFHKETIPDDNCECGLYAHLSLNYFVERNYRFLLFLTECGGKIIVHENGVIRCASQRLVATIITPWNTMSDMEYASKYYNIPLIYENQAAEVVNQSIKKHEIDYEWESPEDKINKQVTQLSKVIISSTMSAKDLINALNQLRSQALFFNIPKDEK